MGLAGKQVSNKRGGRKKGRLGSRLLQERNKASQLVITWENRDARRGFHHELGPSRDSDKKKNHSLSLHHSSAWQETATCSAGACNLLGRTGRRKREQGWPSCPASEPLMCWECSLYCHLQISVVTRQGRKLQSQEGTTTYKVGRQLLKHVHTVNLVLVFHQHGCKVERRVLL